MTNPYTQPLLAQLQNVELDEATLQSFKEMAASSGMLPRHAQAAAEFMQRQSAAGSEAAQANMDAVSQQWDAELREEFGMAYDAKHDRARAAGKAMGIDPNIWHEIRLDNGQNKMLILIIFIYKYLKNLSKI